MSTIHEIPITDIKPRETSQRETPRGVSELAASIRRNGLLHPIVVDSELRIIVGGCRFAAYELINLQGHKGFEKIPVRIFDSLDTVQRELVELEENIKRTDLTWQENVLAIARIHEIYFKENPEATADEFYNYVGYGRAHIANVQRLAAALNGGDEQVQAATTFVQALNIVERNYRRKLDNETNEMLGDALAMFGEAPKAIEEDIPAEPEVGYTDSGAPFIKEKVKLPAKVKPDIYQADFIQFAESYKDKPFNLLHCDFPYGINHGKSGQGGSKEWGAYADDPDVYWALLHALAGNVDKLLYPSAHIIFWFSMKFYSETVHFFNEYFDDIVVDYQPLIWHKTDNKGIFRDVKHTPRNITETALFITRGKREILSPIANCYGSPTNKSEAIHISEKPEPMLRHFMRLCVDGYSEVLDPTCGSGTALRAAESLGAKRVLGLDQNAEYAEAANKQLEKARALASISNATN